MRRRAFWLLAPLLAFSPLSHAAPRPVAPALPAPRALVRHASVDWDDNTVVMRTVMFLKDRRGGPELALSTAEWTHAKNIVGKPGPLEHHFLDTHPQTGAFRNFRDHAGRHNLFLRDLKETVEGEAPWRGPSWTAFVEQLSSREGARRTSLITAREHNADTMHAGLKFLQTRGLIRFVPPRTNLYAVNRPGITVDGRLLTGTTPERKLAVQRALLDKMQLAVAKEGPQRWHFSDDDWANYVATRDALEVDVRKGRWPGIDIKLHFTGLDDPQHAPQSMKLTASAL